MLKFLKLLLYFLYWTLKYGPTRKSCYSEEIAVLWTNALPAVGAFISSVIPGFQDADDILQQVTVAVIKNFDKYDKDRSFVSWAIGIANFLDVDPKIQYPTGK